MRKLLARAAVLLAFGASPALAQGGLNLSFNDCGTAGVQTVALNCASSAGALISMHASVYPAAPMATFASATAIIDVRVGGGSLPPWWQTLAGQCRANSIAMSFDPTSNTRSCGDLWAGTPNVQVTSIQQGVGGPDRLRINGVAAIPAGSEIPIATGTERWVCRATINKASTLTCAGCTQAATIVLTEVDLQGPSEPTQRITAPAYNTCIGLRGGQVFCPGVVTAQNRTWGAVKGLYH